MNGDMAVLSVAVLMLSGLCSPSQSLLYFLFFDWGVRGAILRFYKIYNNNYN